MKRTLAHYLLALVLFSIYGIQVCPFLESLGVVELSLPVAAVFLIQLLSRIGFELTIEKAEIKYRVARQFRIDFLLFVIGAVSLGSFFAFNYQQFPFESFLKIVVGLSVLGFLISCDLALAKERQVAQDIQNSGENIQPDVNPYPLTKKFSWFAVACSLSVIGVVFLVINKDLQWLQQIDNQISMQQAQRYILLEIAFVVGIIMSYMLLIILGYSRNLKSFLRAEYTALSLVAGGDMTQKVPVTSNDEFGLMALRTNQMIEALIKQSDELRQTRDASILSLASLAETRDNETGSHILRTQYYVKTLAQQLSLSEKYARDLDPATIEMLFKSAPLHDVGKVGIPDHILLKPGKLTEEEFEIMKKHPQIGADALAVAEQQLGSNSFLRLAREISLTHHEKWDGSGYPNGLSGEAIPLSGRLMALADVYDALISSRVYKPGMSHQKARQIIVSGRGSHFDPAIVDAFIEMEAVFIAIAARFTDSEEITALSA